MFGDASESLTEKCEKCQRYSLENNQRVIEDTVDRALEDLNISPDFWFTFVDDHLTSMKRELVDTLSQKLNCYDVDVQFTVEIQDATTKSINFLDLTIFNCNTFLKTKWYCKPIASNRILNFLSSHPRNMIMNTARALIKRVLTVSHKSFHRENIAIIQNIMKRNNFPERTIDSLIHQVNNSAQRNRPKSDVSYPYLQKSTTINIASTANNSPLANSTLINPVPASVLSRMSTIESNVTVQAKTERKTYMTMTYIPGLTDKLSKQLKQFAPNLIVAPSPPVKVGGIFSDMKEKLRDGQRSYVVYKVQCKFCKKFYYGETSWCVCDRCKRHKSDVKNMDKKPRATALVFHGYETKRLGREHKFDFETASVVKKVRNKPTLKIQEANQIILNEEKALNFKSDAAHVSPTFYNLIKNSRKHRKKKFEKKRFRSDIVNASVNLIAQTDGTAVK